MFRKNKQTNKLRQSNICIFQLLFLAWGLHSRKQNPYISLHFGTWRHKPNWVKWLLIKSKRKQHKNPSPKQLLLISALKLHIWIWVRNTALPGNNYSSDSTLFAFIYYMPIIAFIYYLPIFILCLYWNKNLHEVGGQFGWRSGGSGEVL